MVRPGMVELAKSSAVVPMSKSPPVGGPTLPFGCSFRSHIRFRETTLPGRQVGVGVGPSLDDTQLIPEIGEQRQGFSRVPSCRGLHWLRPRGTSRKLHSEGGGST